MICFITTLVCYVSKRPIWQPRKSFLFECVPWYCCQRKCHFDQSNICFQSVFMYIIINYILSWNIFWQLFNLWSVSFTTAACHVSKRPIWQPRKSFLFECVPWYCCQRKCHFDRAHNWGYYLWRHISFSSKNLCFHKRNAQIWKKKYLHRGVIHYTCFNRESISSQLTFDI